MSPSPSGSFSIRLDGVDEETDQVQSNSSQSVNPQGQDVTKIGNNLFLHFFFFLEALWLPCRALQTERVF